MSLTGTVLPGTIIVLTLENFWYRLDCTFWSTLEHKGNISTSQWSALFSCCKEPSALKLDFKIASLNNYLDKAN